MMTTGRSIATEHAMSSPSLSEGASKGVRPRGDEPRHRVLIVSPQFPPINAPDMHRVRTSLPYFREFGWDPYVLAVAPESHQDCEPLLVDTLPPNIPIERVRAVPLAVSQRFGIGNIALRALPFLYRAGSRLIARHAIDVVYFSTTMFLSMPLGRLWKRQYGTPYVLDIQDPWVSDYYETHSDATPPPKYGLARRLHGVLEPWTMKNVDAVIAVSASYIETLRARYSWLIDTPCTVLPFGVAAHDFEVLASHPQHNPFFDRSNGRWHGVYTGVAGDYMAPALRILCRGLQKGLETAPHQFERVSLHFIGTDYATDRRSRKRVEPIAAQIGVERHVQEQTARAPYFQALQAVSDADCLIVIGSDDPAYVASKLQPYVFARKPILAIVHESSPMVSLLRRAHAVLVTFSSDPRSEDLAASQLVPGWRHLLAGAADIPLTLPACFESYSARELTRRQCAVFDSVLARPLGTSMVSCTN